MKAQGNPRSSTQSQNHNHVVLDLYNAKYNNDIYPQANILILM